LKLGYSQLKKFYPNEEYIYNKEYDWYYMNIAKAYISVRYRLVLGKIEEKGRYSDSQIMRYLDNFDASEDRCQFRIEIGDDNFKGSNLVMKIDRYGDSNMIQVDVNFLVRNYEGLQTCDLTSFAYECLFGNVDRYFESPLFYGSCENRTTSYDNINGYCMSCSRFTPKSDLKFLASGDNAMLLNTVDL